MIRVALTGGIATGKSHVRARFEELGVPTSDADTFARAVVAPGTEGIEAVVRAFDRRESGLGAADWGYEELWRDWYDADERVIVEIRERSWLRSAPADVLDQRTCVVIRFRGDRICEMRDYSDAQLYEEFRRRHPELPRFAR